MQVDRSRQFRARRLLSVASVTSSSDFIPHCFNLVQSGLVYFTYHDLVPYFQCKAQSLVVLDEKNGDLEFD